MASRLAGHFIRTRIYGSFWPSPSVFEIWVELDRRNEKISYKVRDHSLAKVPLLLVVGKREAENRQVALRRLGGEAQEVLDLQDAISRLTTEAAPPAVAA